MSRRMIGLAVLTLVGLGLRPAAQGAGFAVSGQGARALGRAEAFVAQADDATAIFYNVGGLGFLDRPVTSYGVNFDWRRGRFTGEQPFPGDGAEGKDRPGINPLPHLYHTQPLGHRWRLGAGFSVPFGMEANWRRGEPGWAGASLVESAVLGTYDLTPSLGVRLGRKWGAGAGVIARVARVELERHVPTTAPVAGSVVDLLAFELRSDLELGLGYQGGLLHKPVPWLSWGVSYRSAVAVDFAETGTLQAPERVTPLPFTSALEFPDQLTVGVALRRSGGLVVELDVARTGWSRFDGWSFRFSTAPALDEIRLAGWKDVSAYRLGVEVPSASGGLWRAGAFFDPTPERSAVALDPLLPDADRWGLTVGYSSGDLPTRFARRYGGDVALAYIQRESRRTAEGAADLGFHGRYQSHSWLLTFTLTYF